MLHFETGSMSYVEPLNFFFNEKDAPVEPIASIILKSWAVMSIMAPYLLLGFFVAGLLGAFVPSSLIETHLGKCGLGQIVKAALLGVPIPLCSCSVIPVTASLRKHGASDGATISFLTSTPQTGVDSIAATWGLLGPLFALFRTLIAFITGVLCGLAVETFAPATDESSPRPATTAPPPPLPIGQRWRKVFSYGFGVLPRDIGRALLVGILVSGVLGAWIDPDFFTQTLQSEWLSMLAVMGLGIPLYVCSTGSIPIALALIGAGLSPGAALVFLITGPATNAATIATLYETMGRRIVGLYLSTLAGCALIAGWLLNRILSAEIILEQIHEHTTKAGPFEQVCALILAGLLLSAFRPRKQTCTCHK